MKSITQPARFLSVLTMFAGMLLSPIVAATDSASEKLVVYSVNYPLAYFAQRIGGNHVDVHLPVPAEHDPAFWMPDAATITDYQQADLILLNGAGYAKWVSKVSLPGRKLVNTSALFREVYIPVKSSITHQHGPGGDHSHAGTAFTTWLDFSLASQQAHSIYVALKSARPDLEGAFENNYRKLEQELTRLDSDMKDAAAGYNGRPLIASHPVYQYLAQRYGLNLKSVTWEPDAMPEPDQWQALPRLLRDHPADVMLWERKPLPAVQERLALMGISVVVFDPVMNAPADGDFMSKMRGNVLNFAEAQQGTHSSRR